MAAVCFCSDENENLTDRGTDASCCVPDGRTPVDGSVSDGPLKTQQGGVSKQEVMEVENNMAAASSSFVLGFVAGKLSAARRRLEDTRDVLRSAPSGRVKLVLSHYVSMVTRELPLIGRPPPRPEPASRSPAARRAGGAVLDGVLPPDGVSSVSRRTDACPLSVQRLEDFPPPLSSLPSLSPAAMLDALRRACPGLAAPQSVFLLSVADAVHAPAPACLVLSPGDVTVLAAASPDAMTLRRRLDLRGVAELQVGLGGQHVRLLGARQDAALAVFTHSAALTQELLRALLHAAARGAEGAELSPLLSGDLMALSLDWTSRVPDLVLDGGLRVSSRFKRVLADLLYVVHGNMAAAGRPGLAHVRPLLYAGVRLRGAARWQRGVLQLLLTDSHLALLQEDAVFHPAPRGDGRVASRPQFQDLRLRARPEVRRLLVAQSGGCVAVDVLFANQREAEGEGAGPRRPEDTPPNATRRRHGDTWKLLFGCSSEAAVLIQQLSA